MEGVPACSVIVLSKTTHITVHLINCKQQFGRISVCRTCLGHSMKKITLHYAVHVHDIKNNTSDICFTFGWTRAYVIFS